MTITKTQTKFICYVVNFAVCFTVLFSCFTFAVPTSAVSVDYSYTSDELFASNNLGFRVYSTLLSVSGFTYANPGYVCLVNYVDSSFHYYDEVFLSRTFTLSSYSDDLYRASEGLYGITFLYELSFFDETGYSLSSYSITDLNFSNPVITLSYDIPEDVFVNSSLTTYSTYRNLSIFGYQTTSSTSIGFRDSYSKTSYSFGSSDSYTGFTISLDDYADIGEYNEFFTYSSSAYSQISPISFSYSGDDIIYGVSVIPFPGRTSTSTNRYFYSSTAQSFTLDYYVSGFTGLPSFTVSFTATETNELEQLQELNQNVLEIYNYISEPDEETQARIDELTAQQESIDAQLKDISAALDVTADDDALYNALDSGLSVIDNVSSTVGAGSALGTLIFDGSLSFLPWLLCFIIGFGFIMFILYGKRG